MEEEGIVFTSGKVLYVRFSKREDSTDEGAAIRTYWTTDGDSVIRVQREHVAAYIGRPDHVSETPFKKSKTRRGLQQMHDDA